MLITLSQTNTSFFSQLFSSVCFKTHITSTQIRYLLSATNTSFQVVLIVVLHATARIRLLAHRTVGTHRAVRLAEPVILLAVHRILLSPVQTVVAPMIHAPLQLAARTAARSVPDMVALIAVVVRHRRVAHRAAPERLVVLQVLLVRTLSVLRFFVAVAAKLPMARRTAHHFLLGERRNAFNDRSAAGKRADAAYTNQDEEEWERF